MGLVDEVVEESKLGERAVEVGVKEGERVGHGVWGMIKVGLTQDVVVVVDLVCPEGVRSGCCYTCQAFCRPKTEREGEEGESL